MVLNWSSSVSKPDFLYAECSLSLFCIVKINSASNQGLELAVTITFSAGATESIPHKFIYKLLNMQDLYRKYFEFSVKLIFFFMLPQHVLLCNVSLMGQVFRYAYEMSVVMFFMCKTWGHDQTNQYPLHPTG